MNSRREEGAVPPIMRDYYVVPNIGVRAPATLYYVRAQVPDHVRTISYMCVLKAGRSPKKADRPLPD